MGACLAVHWAVARQTAHIHVLPLKGAPVIFVDSPGREGNLLVDCADYGIRRPNSQALPVRARSQPACRRFALAVGLLPHFGGVTVIMANFSVGPHFHRRRAKPLARLIAI